MKKNKINKKVIIITLIVLVIICSIVFGTYMILNDENKLSVEEKEWITENINNVQSINIPNNLDIFGKSGSGVLFDFIKDLENEYDLKVNTITYNIGEDVSSRSFKIVYEPKENNQIVFYKEHYVVISKQILAQYLNLQILN